MLAEYTSILTNQNSKGELPRCDYRECAELMMILLGAVPPRGVRWYKPGGLHSARWMSTILYSAKIYAFSEQLEMDDGDLDLYSRFLMFTSLYYVPWWLAASRGVDAPVDDLIMWNHLKQYRSVDPVVADAALASLERHLWYLTEELTPLSLFSDKLSNVEKSKMAKRINREKSLYDPGSSLGQPVFPVITGRTRINDLIGPNSWVMFSAFDSTDWLSKPVKSWPTDEGYIEMLDHILHLKIVNDIAERGVKLVDDYSGSITTDEDQKQCVYHVVEEHRRIVDKVTKEKMKLLTIYK